MTHPNANPFAPESWNLTLQMKIHQQSPAEASRLKAEAATIDEKQPHESRNADVQKIARALAVEVRRLAPGGADGGTLRRISLGMDATDEQHNEALRCLSSVAGRRGDGRWWPHAHVSC